MTVTIPLKLVLAILLACFVLGFVYPFVAWLFIDIGLNLGLGLGRVYALWAGAFLVLLTTGVTVYLLQKEN